MGVINNKIHIALAFDQNFITPFYVLLTSIFQNNKRYRFSFHIIAEDLSEEERIKIRSFVSNNRSEIHFYAVDKDLVRQFILPEAGHISAATYYRLFFSELLPGDITNLLYLDTDIIVVGDLSKLFFRSMNSFAIGAVADPQIELRPELGIRKAGDYFNAGVLLINLPEWRRQKVSERAITFLNEFQEKAIWGDQDALNYVLLNAWYKLEKVYNVTFYDIPKRLQKKGFKTYLQDKVIIHFTTQNKPWLLTCSNRLRYLYHYYLQESPHASLSKYKDESLRGRYRYKLIKRQLKELLIDFGIPV